MKNYLFVIFIFINAITLYAQSKPNIILVITDDQGYGPVGRHGHPFIKTPHLDKLYDTSTRFTRFLVSPTCAPTRAALMTGRHPMKNGVTHTIFERERMTLKATTLPQVLVKANYQSGIFGKWHLGDEEAYQPRSRGFHESFIHGAGGIGQAFRGSCADAPGNKYFDPAIRHNGKFVKTKGYCTDIFFTAAINWMEKMKEKKEPFFAYISTNAPHGPFIAPEKYKRRFLDMGINGRAANYYGMVENIDDNMGRLLNKLEEWKLYKDTIVIFMSDNGTTGNGAGRSGAVIGKTKGGKQIHCYNAGMKGQKGSADEGGVRVPFFIRWDGRWQAGKDIDRIAAHIDLLPTFANLLGVDYPKQQVEGASLLPLLDGDKKQWPDRYLFTHKGRWKSGSKLEDQIWKGYAIRNQKYRFSGGRLYDMEKDPGQKKDIASEHPEIVSNMKKAFEKFWKETIPLMDNEKVPLAKERPYHVWYKEQKAKEGIPEWKP